MFVAIFLQENTRMALNLLIILSLYLGIVLVVPALRQKNWLKSIAVVVTIMVVTICVVKINDNYKKNTSIRPNVSSQVKCTLFRHKLHTFLPAVVR